VPPIDGGTVRLPRLIGQGRALDMILTGRAVGAEEAMSIGLVDRVVEPGTALAAAADLASGLVALPQHCLRSDRDSARRSFDGSFADAMAYETAAGSALLRSPEIADGVSRFVGGAGRHGT
jgi:enoyl-CoA hydratase